MFVVESFSFDLLRKYILKCFQLDVLPFSIAKIALRASEGGFLATSLPRNTSSSLSRCRSSNDSESSLTGRDPNAIDGQSSASSQEKNADDSPLSVAAMFFFVCFYYYFFIISLHNARIQE